ncbi:chaperonin 10-like protein [Lipomyces oligophaga]|uniref:chaperonin 10-like protein n=1 Tax=Lipomyces oligophaga TaxID=45792 RepID=UPI0034CE4C83
MPTFTIPKEHQALVLTAPKGPLEVQTLSTRLPVGREVLVKVEVIAMNHVDYIQLETGFHVEHYPTVLGTDVAGTIVATGSEVSQPEQIQPGTRVLAFATNFFAHSLAEFGAYQQYVIVKDWFITPIPDSLDFHTAATIPMGTWTGWAGFYTAGLTVPIAGNAAELPSDVKAANGSQAILVWGAGSSVGSSALQQASSLGYKVYVTSKSDHHESLLKIGATKAFDYRDEDVVQKIADAAIADGVSLKLAYVAVKTSIPAIDAIALANKGTDANPGDLIVVSAPLMEDADNMHAEEKGVTIKFVLTPDDDEERAKFFYWVFRIWTAEKIKSGEFVATQKSSVIEGGLSAIPKTLSVLQKYEVSREKFEFEP